MRRIRELKEKKVKLINESRAMLDKAESEKRRLSDSEREEQKKLFEQIEDITAEIRQGELDAELRDRGTPQSWSPTQERSDRPRLVLPSGQEIRCFAHGERIAAHSSLSLGRLIRAQVLGDSSRAVDELRAIGTVSTGGYMVPSSISGSVVELARSLSVFGKAGGFFFEMPTSEMHVVRVAAGVSPQWRQEHQAIQESEPSFEACILRARSLGALCRVSREQLQDAANSEAVIEQELAAALASELDRAALLGIGAAGEPQGIYNAAGINEVVMGAGADGAAFTDYDPFLDAIELIETANGQPNAAIFNPRSARNLRGLKTGLTSDKTTLQAPEEYKALQRFVSTVIPNTYVQGSEDEASVALIGDFKQAAIGVRLQLEIELGALTNSFAQNEVGIRAIMRADTVFFRENHFCRIIGIAPEGE